MDGDARPHPHPPSPAPTVEDCGLNPLECLVLELIRWICDAYGRPDRFGWETAIIRAEAVLGPEDGPPLFAAVAAVMTAVRCHREGGFQYSNPACAECARRVLPLEHDLLRVLRAGRRGDGSGIDAHALLLLEGRDTRPLRVAVLRLGAVVARLEARSQAFGPDRPSLD